MAAISSNLITAEPSVEGDRRRARRGGGAGVDDFERRARGSDVRWSRDWDGSFDDALIGARITAFLAT